MPIPTPRKGEKQDDFMERCMHEASSGSDRTNEQNVAICMDAWRNKDKSDSSEKNMNNFKTLAEAKAGYDALFQESVQTREKLLEIPNLEQALSEAKAFNAASATENENFRALIVQKDAEIAGLKTEKEAFQAQVSGLKTEVETLQKQQKTARIQARELVAASGGAPISIDQAEIARMQAGDEREFVQRMAKERDPAKLSQLYSEYNRLFRSNGKSKK